MKTENLKRVVDVVRGHGYGMLPAAAVGELRALESRVLALEDALRPFALFAEKFDANPIRGIADTLYAIHAEEKGAELRLSDCRTARKTLLGEDS